MKQTNTSQQWRGVNLGGWFVLEKWLTPSLFTGYDADDEYGLCVELGDQAESVLSMHRSTFVTEADFRWIAENGLNAVRLPVGYWLFGDEPPFIGCVQYVDKAFRWAEKYGLSVLLDVHALPGSQNGKDHSGRKGKIGWPSGANKEKSLRFIRELAKRYADRPALMGIQVINEPVWKIGKRKLTSYYEQAYDEIRKYCANDVAVVISDAFRPKRWKRALRDGKYSNVVLDIHLYQAHSKRDKRRSVSSHLKQAAVQRQKLLRRIQRHQSVIIGEWSIALPQKVYDNQDDASRQALRRAYGSIQTYTYGTTSGWFYWTYKTEYGGVWSYRHMVESGNLSHRLGE